MNRPAASLPWSAVLGYGLGDMANNFSVALGLLFLLNYYTDVAEIPAAAAGTLLLVVRIYDGAMDLVVGRAIDRYRGHPRWGRLRPWLLFGALPVLALNVAVFSLPSHWSSPAKLVYASLTYALLGTAYAFVSIAYGSLAGAMTQAPEARIRLGAARSVLGGSSFVILAFIVTPKLHQLHGPALQTALTHLTLELAGCGLLLYLLCFLATKEKVARPAPALHWRESLPVLLDNRPLQHLCLVTLLTLTGTASASASSIYFARYVLGEPHLFPVLILAGSLAGLGLAAPLSPWLAKRLGKCRGFTFAMLLAAAGHGLLLWLPPGAHAAIIGSMAAGAFGSTLGMVLLWALEAETVEYGQARSGLRLEGSNYAIFSLTRKLALALGSALPAFLLARAAYVPNMEIQSEAALLAIRHGIALLPMLAFSLAGLAMLRYPLPDHTYFRLLETLQRK